MGEEDGGDLAARVLERGQRVGGSRSYLVLVAGHVGADGREERIGRGQSEQSDKYERERKRDDREPEHHPLDTRDHINSSAHRLGPADSARELGSARLVSIHPPRSLSMPGMAIRHHLAFAL